MKRQLSYINQKVDKDIWGIDILDTDAYYNPTDNSINIIPGYFCKVTYNSDGSITTNGSNTGGQTHYSSYL